MLLFQLLIIAFLIVIFLEDIFSRSVHWYWFPLLAIVLICARLVNHEPPQQLLLDTAINIGFVSVQLMLVTAYFSIKQKQLVNITHALLGWGDVWLLGCLACYLSPFNFIAFYICSLTLILIVWIAYQLVNPKGKKQIPLAGLQALLLAVLCAAGCLYPIFSLTNDEKLLQLLSR